MKGVLLGGALALGGAAIGFVFGAGLDFSKPTNGWEALAAIGTVGTAALAATASIGIVRERTRERRDNGILATTSLYMPIITIHTTLNGLKSVLRVGKPDSLGTLLTNEMILQSIKAIWQAPRGVIEKYDRPTASALEKFRSQLGLLNDYAVRQLFGTPELTNWLDAQLECLRVLVEHIEVANKKASEFWL